MLELWKLTVIQISKAKADYNQNEPIDYSRLLLFCEGKYNNSAEGLCFGEKKLY
jgi:hypothetical protein